MKFEDIDLGVGVHNYNSTATYVPGDLVYIAGRDLYYVTSNVILSDGDDSVSSALSDGKIVSYYDYINSDVDRIELRTTKNGNVSTIEGIDSSNNIQFKLTMTSGGNPSLVITVDSSTIKLDTNRIKALSESVIAKVKLRQSQDITTLLSSGDRGIAEVIKLDGTDHKYITVGYDGSKITLNGGTANVSPLSINGANLLLDSSYIGTLTCQL